MASHQLLWRERGLLWTERGFLWLLSLRGPLVVVLLRGGMGRQELKVSLGLLRQECTSFLE